MQEFWNSSCTKNISSHHSNLSSLVKMSRGFPTHLSKMSSPQPRNKCWFSTLMGNKRGLAWSPLKTLFSQYLFIFYQLLMCNQETQFEFHHLSFPYSHPSVTSANEWWGLGAQRFKKQSTWMTKKKVSWEKEREREWASTTVWYHTFF